MLARLVSMRRTFSEMASSLAVWSARAALTLTYADTDPTMITVAADSAMSIVWVFCQSMNYLSGVDFRLNPC